MQNSKIQNNHPYNVVNNLKFKSVSHTKQTKKHEIRVY